MCIHFLTCKHHGIRNKPVLTWAALFPAICYVVWVGPIVTHSAGVGEAEVLERTQCGPGVWPLLHHSTPPLYMFCNAVPLMHANAFARLSSQNQVIYGECSVCLYKQWVCSVVWQCFRNDDQNKWNLTKRLTPTCKVTKLSEAGIKVVQNLIAQDRDNEAQARGAWKSVCRIHIKVCRVALIHACAGDEAAVSSLRDINQDKIDFVK